jgi:3-isopropylmalate/(R)-2-methylmalate dehydratase small subunit
MTGIIKLEGIAAPFLCDNVDAMTIAPRTPAEKGGGKTQGGAETVRSADLFAHLRFPEGKLDLRFVLNQPAYERAVFLIAGDHFGCGSAREHAVWALCAFGIRCVVAPSFGPLFYGNCFKNGLVPVELEREKIERIARQCGPDAPAMKLDVVDRELVTPSGEKLHFSLPEFRLTQLRDGLDEIDMTMQRRDSIIAYYAKARAERPWVR